MLYSNEKIKVLFENFTKSKNFKSEAENSFWDEFFKNQMINQTEIVGELKPIYFNFEQQNKMTDLLKDSNNINVFLLKKDYFYNPKVHPDIINKNKVWAMKQAHKYYYNDYMSTCIELFEFDYEVDKLNIDKYDSIKTKQKINMYNEYSKRKLESFKVLNYVGEGRIKSSIRDSRGNLISSDIGSSNKLEVINKIKEESIFSNRNNNINTNNYVVNTINIVGGNSRNFSERLKKMKLDMKEVNEKNKTNEIKAIKIKTFKDVSYIHYG